MRRIRNGYAGMKRFLVLTNYPSPMTEKNYRKRSSVHRNSVKEVAETVMQEAALEIYNNKHDADCDDNIVDTGISVDGTWQKRRFTSLNGAVAAISIKTGRILDVEVMTRYCQGCINIEKFKENADLYEHLKLDHMGKSNHVGVERIFLRSIETRRLCYTDYYGGRESQKFCFCSRYLCPESSK